MKISEYLSKDDIARFTAKSDLLAWSLVLGNWLMIAMLFTLVAAYPNPLTIILAMVWAMALVWRFTKPQPFRHVAQQLLKKVWFLPLNQVSMCPVLVG